MSSYWLTGLLVIAPLFASAVDFQREVRPILSNNCFACHGPDKETRLAGLRLDLRADAFAVRKNGAPIVPGDPARSLLYQRISADKPSLRMPPSYSHKTLTAAEIDTLKHWIEQGADWKEQWSFIAPIRPAPPTVQNDRWVRNPIDRFILSKLAANGLAPAQEADRRTLIRRLSLDLTGLPPSPAEVAQFINDNSQDAYEKLVDRLLASPRYGEHRARYWLDAARYADTHGIHIDNYREMWPYRDWVIDAFNRNLTFDRFTIEQLAGDLLPNRTVDQQIATGFHRCNVTTNEAGVILDEVEAIYAKDRVDTTSAVWLGLTVGCATCHDHKFDPISQRDHYALAAFFRNTTQGTMDGNVSDTPPILLVPAESDRQRWPEVQRAEADIRKSMRALASDPAHPIVPRPQSANSEIQFEPKTTRPIFDADHPFSISLQLRMPVAEESFVLAGQFDSTKEKNRGWKLEISSRIPVLRLTGDDEKGIEARAGHMDQLKPGSQHNIVVTYDGTRERQGLSMYLDGNPITLQGSEPLSKIQGPIATAAPLRLSGSVSNFHIFNRELSEDEALLGDPTLQNGDPKYRDLAAQLQSLVHERRAIRRRAAVTHVMEERSDRKPFANILYRGMYDQPREKVEPAVPAALPPMPESYPRNRLGLAQWLVSDSNPLTARVTVNRFWQEIFGTGIVKTSEDFGSQGEPPTHPELLDWLAVEFRESGWDTKKLFRLIMTSAAYRQAAIATEEKLKKDPENRLVSRGPRYRMDAEMVRDYALAASGLLTPDIGGPSVRPYQPDGLWETVAMLTSNTRLYKRDTGGKLYRRSLYTFWKRSAPPASMDIFNAPTREQCTVRRERTNTPLQALVTMNDPQFVEAARTLAQRAMLRDRSHFDLEVDLISQSLLARSLDQRERLIAKNEFASYLKYYDSNPTDARKLIAVGDSTADSSLPVAEFAAMTMLVNQLMNLDEVLNK